MSFQLDDTIGYDDKGKVDDGSSEDANIRIKCRTELTSYFKKSDHSNNNIYFSEVR